MKRALILLALTAGSAIAAPPENADPALAPWFRSLNQPGTGYNCCSMADCRPVRTRDRNGKIEAFIARETFRDGTDQWVIVPEEVIIRGIENPVGEPVLCYLGGMVRCFVQGAQG